MKEVTNINSKKIISNPIDFLLEVIEVLKITEKSDGHKIKQITLVLIDDESQPSVMSTQDRNADSLWHLEVAKRHILINGIASLLPAKDKNDNK